MRTCYLVLILVAALLGGCAAPWAAVETPAPTNTALPAPTLTLAPQPAAAGAQVTEAGGLMMSAANLRLSEYRPDKDLLEIDVCVQNPDENDWFIDKPSVTFDGVTLAQASATGADPALAPFAGQPASCHTLEFHVPVQADLNMIRLEIPAVRTSPTFEQICGVVIPEAQRWLDAYQPGVRLDCRLTDLGYEAWVAEKPASLSAADAQKVFDSAFQAGEYQHFAVRGPWVFSFTDPVIPYQAARTLLDPAARPTPPALDFRALNMHYDDPAFYADVCFKPPSSAGWQLSDVTLEYVSGIETIPVRQEKAPSVDGLSCTSLSFDVPASANLEGALIKVYAIQPPESQTRRPCREYQPLLQAALDNRGYGIKVVCDEQSWGWQLRIIEKPAAMSDQEAAAIVHSDELIAIRGYWPLPVDLNQ
jgi:hypothetical protein